MKPPRPTLSILLRALLFNLGYAGFTIFWSFVCMALGPFLSFERRFALINVWTRFIFWMLRNINGVEIEVRGRENIPSGQPVVIAANHQSNLETFYLQLVFSPQSTILKRSLLWIPFFGWGLRMLRPIAIDRKRASAALRDIIRQGAERLRQGMYVTIFPEGTRRDPGEPGDFHSGGAMLAQRARVPLLPVAHNAGLCWPRKSMLPRPGRVIFEIGEPIASDQYSTKELNARAAEWVTERALALARQAPAAEDASPTAGNGRTG